MKLELREMVLNKSQQWVDVFNKIDGCVLSQPQEDRVLIASPVPVPWNDYLKPQYNESKNKIGYIMPKQTCVGLYIDFPKNTLTYEDVYEVINHKNILEYIPSGQRASQKRSWWRFNSGDGFDSINVVLHADCLAEYDVDREELKQLLSHIVKLSKF